MSYDIAKLDMSELEKMGVIKNPIDGELLHKYDWLTDFERDFFLRVYFAGDDGLHKREVKKLTKTESIVRVEATGLIAWERDLNGREMFLTRTWKGQEFGEALLRKAKAMSHKECPLRNPE